jgi:hypothetical protein
LFPALFVSMTVLVLTDSVDFSLSCFFCLQGGAVKDFSSFLSVNGFFQKFHCSSDGAEKVGSCPEAG